MKRMLTLLLLFFLLGILGLYFYNKIKDYQVNIAKSRSSQNEISMIASIQEKVRSIDSEKDYQEKTLINEEFLDQMTDGGGELTGFYKYGQIRKVFVRIGLSYGVKVHEFYFGDNKLIQVYEREEYFPYDDDRGAFDYTKLQLAFEGYYYLTNGELINKQVKGEKRYPENSADLWVIFPRMAEEYVGLLKQAPFPVVP